MCADYPATTFSTILTIHCIRRHLLIVDKYTVNNLQLFPWKITSLNFFDFHYRVPTFSIFLGLTTKAITSLWTERSFRLNNLMTEYIKVEIRNLSYDLMISPIVKYSSISLQYIRLFEIRQLQNVFLARCVRFTIPANLRLQTYMSCHSTARIAFIGHENSSQSLCRKSSSEEVAGQKGGEEGRGEKIRSPLLFELLSNWKSARRIWKTKAGYLVGHQLAAERDGCLWSSKRTGR